MYLCTFMLTALIAAAAPSLASRHVQAKDRVQLTLSPHMLGAGGTVRAILRVDRHAENRVLRVTIDGPAYASSTERQLDGEDSARTFEMIWQTLPGGEYVTSVEVEGTSGIRHRLTERFTVAGPSDASLGAASTRGHRQP